MQLDDIQGSEANFQFRSRRLEEDKKTLAEENDRLSLEINRKTNELSALQREKVNRGVFILLASP